VGSPLFAPLDRSLLPPRPSSNVWRVDIRSQGHLIKGRLSCRCPTAQRGTRLSARIQSRGSLTRYGLLSTLTLHPAEKFHGFRDSGGKRTLSPPRLLSHHDTQKPCATHGTDNWNLIGRYAMCFARGTETSRMNQTGADDKSRLSGSIPARFTRAASHRGGKNHRSARCRAGSPTTRWSCPPRRLPSGPPRRPSPS
jgi:hypothetical protein